MEKQMKHKIFPVFYKLNYEKIVVVGGGSIATRRVKTLLQFDFEIVVVAKEASKELKGIEEQGDITLHTKEIKIEDEDTIMRFCEGAYLVVACTDDKLLNEQIVRTARAHGSLVNACDNKSLCDFHFPGIHAVDGVVIAVAGDGSDHHKTAKVLQKIRDGISYED
ncbi:MAG: bifunctional precorrin-2 dehydrogenase/sirohydrochlorin ferrochelatase [Lachnospiraceae bacterium]